jgi:hypothetical protein
VNFTSGTILPVYEAVIVVADLYLQSGELERELAADPGALAGLEYAGRFGGRERLPGGWRGWLAHWLGRGDLAGAPVAAVAAAASGGGDAAGGTARMPNGSASPQGATRWIATPVELVAGLTRVHLDRRGIMRLAPDEQAALAEAFQRTFAGSGLELEPLSDGQFLAITPGIAAVATTEPARCAGGVPVVPHGPSAAPLLRLMAEIEMWLHGVPLNRERAARGAAAVTGLWLWGATGEEFPDTPARRYAAAGGNRPGATVAFGADAFVAGLARLAGHVLRPLPDPPAAAFAAAGSERALVVAELARGLTREEPWALSAAAAALDGRLVRPALEALASGQLQRLTLIANDTRVAVGRRSGLKRWRRRRAGLGAFT